MARESGTIERSLRRLAFYTAMTLKAAAAALLRSKGGTMHLATFFSNLYNESSTAKEEVTAAGGPKKWAEAAGFTIADGAKPGSETLSIVTVQRAPPCKYFAQGACSFGDRCRFRHDRTSSSAQSSARPARGPRQPPATQLKCTAEVVKLKRNADGARAATALAQCAYKPFPCLATLLA